MEKPRNNKQDIEKEKIFRGAITIVYKNINRGLFFLVTENTKTGNISFVSGAEEDIDERSLEKTAQREIKEELSLSSSLYKLIPTTVKHEFVFNSKKVGRAGKKASYQVYLVNASSIKENIAHTTELKNVMWMTKKEVLNSLTFPELKEIFKKAIRVIKP